jgi:DNA-binding transcriptional LysR family regulator
MLNKTNLWRIDLNLLVLFEAVMQERHVGRAAARLNISPSAVSHGLGRLRRLLHDPLFLRNPKGVVPTTRAAALAPPIADILARAQNVIGSVEQFDAKTSTRRFTLGTPDGVSAVLLPPLLTEIRKNAPGIDLSVRNLVGQFHLALTDLDERTLDVALVPLDTIPARFVSRTLYDEEFVIVKRKGHRLSTKPTLAQYAAAMHVVVSLSGDPRGPIDDMLAQHGLARRVALTASNFFLALAIVAETDLVAALPRRFAAMHAKRYPVAFAEPPVPLLSSPIRAIAPKVATMDAGLSWLLDLIERVSAVKTSARRSRVSAKAKRD